LDGVGRIIGDAGPGIKETGLIEKSNPRAAADRRRYSSRSSGLGLALARPAITEG